MKLIFTLLLLSFTTAMAIAQTPFITRWNTGSGTSIAFPGVGNNYTIRVKNAAGTVVQTHTGITRTLGTNFLITGLTAGANYNIEVSNAATGGFRQFFAPSSGTDILKLRGVQKWGDINWLTMRESFKGAVNMQVADTAGVLILPRDIGYMFANCTGLTGNASFNTWNTNNVELMDAMFFSATNFNTAIGAWNTANVTNMHSVFEYASSFNQNINTWNTAKVTDMSQMFHAANHFNQPLDSWNTSNVTTMHSMFEEAYVFNQPLNTNTVTGAWNTAKVINMAQMFQNASVFNQPLNNWNTAAVTTMAAMFHSATIFNQPIGNWNTANVLTMRDMFGRAAAFDQPLNTWVVSNVTTMNGMFAYASSFNQPLDTWNTANVTDMYGMFGLAASFNQNIGMWNLSSVNDVVLMLSYSGLSCINYTNTLIGWAGASTTPNNLNLGAHMLDYGSAAMAAITTLTTTKGWTIIHGGSCEIPLPVQLVSLDAKLQGTQVNLTWVTASETNNKGFYVQRSTDGINWQRLFFVHTKAVNGNTNHSLQYNYTDNQPSNGKNLYRLEQIDFDEKFQFSKVVHINVTSPFAIHVFPNPATKRITVSGLKGSGKLYLTNMSGQHLQVVNINTSNCDINVQNLPTGIYLVSVIDNNGLQVASQKIIKQ